MMSLAYVRCAEPKSHKIVTRAATMPLLLRQNHLFNLPLSFADRLINLTFQKHEKNIYWAETEPECGGQTMWTCASIRDAAADVSSKNTHRTVRHDCRVFAIVVVCECVCYIPLYIAMRCARFASKHYLHDDRHGITLRAHTHHALFVVRRANACSTEKNVAKKSGDKCQNR